jgi:hypothetical protein
MGRIVRVFAIAFVVGALSAVGVAQSSLLQLVFRVPDGSPIRSSPVIDLAKNAIYFGADDGNLYAIPLISAEQPRRAKWVFSPDPDPAKRRPYAQLQSLTRRATESISGPMTASSTR